MEKTLILVKPDAMLKGYGGAIISRFQGQDLKLRGLKMLQMDRALAERHYAVHKGKPFFEDLVKYIISAPIIAAVFEAEGAVTKARAIMGATDPSKASKGTIRADFGANIQENAVHGSDSPENAEKEVSLFFAGLELLDY